MEAPLEEPVASQYAAAAAMWGRVYREFLVADEEAAAALEEAAAAAPSGACAWCWWRWVCLSGRRGQRAQWAATAGIDAPSD